MALADHISMPVKSCRIWGDVYDANGREIYTDIVSGPVLACAINSYDDMLETMKRVDVFFDALASATQIGEQTQALAAHIKAVIAKATPVTRMGDKDARLPD